MAEESINTSLAVDIIAPEGGNLRSSSLGQPSVLKSGQNKHPDYNRASIGSYRDEGNSRRHSTGKPTLPKIGQNIFPRHFRASAGSLHDVVNSSRHSSGKPSSPNCMVSVSPCYLRASTGSCHDFCKYGRKHAVEIKASCSISKMLMTPPLDRPNPTESGVPAERNTTKVVKPKPSPVSETLFPDSPIILKPQVSSPSKRGYSSRQDSANEKNKAQNEKKKTFTGKRIPSMKPKTTTLTPLPSFDHSGGLKGSRNSEIRIGKMMGSSRAAVRKVLASPVPSLSQIPSINRTVSLNVKKYRSPKLLSPLKDQNMVTKAELKQSDNEKVPEKTLHVIKVETENEVMESTQSGSNLHSPPSPLLLSPKFSSIPKSPSLPFNGDEAREEFEYTDSEVDESDDSISESCETVSLHKVEPSDVNWSRAPRKAKVGLSQDKDCSPMKLKFTRGKVLDLQSKNSGPRKLRFRRGRVLGENQDDSKAEVRRRRFKKTGDDVDTNGNNVDSGKVVLRHQDVEGKKDAQGLFNNVIEETASKLVESRKSKVKALVGAFETVISLQESKPSPQTVS